MRSLDRGMAACIARKREAGNNPGRSRPRRFRWQPSAGQTSCLRPSEPLPVRLMWFSFCASSCPPKCILRTNRQVTQNAGYPRVGGLLGWWWRRTAAVVFSRSLQRRHALPRLHREAERREKEQPGQARPYEKYKAGELVVVDQWSGGHQLNFRNTDRKSTRL